MENTNLSWRGPMPHELTFSDHLYSGTSFVVNKSITDPFYENGTKEKNYFNYEFHHTNFLLQQIETRKMGKKSLDRGNFLFRWYSLRYSGQGKVLEKFAYFFGARG